MLNVCIDIDGTLTEPYYWLPFVNAYFGKQLKPNEIREYEIHKVVGIKREEYLHFYNNHKFTIHRNPSLRQNATYFVNLIASKHNVHFVTAREKELELITYSYLNRNNISYNSLHVTGNTNKVDYAKQLHSDIFIEDCMANALLISEAGYKVLLIDTEYNQYSTLRQHPLIARVFNWEEIYQIIELESRIHQAI